MNMLYEEKEERWLLDFQRYMEEEEKSSATIEKYERDVRKFLSFQNGREISKTLTLEYKEYLIQNYAVSSVNSMLAAMNSFLRFIRMAHCCVKQLKVQRQVYCMAENELTKAEYIRLVKAAREKKNRRLSLILETICGTGIRVSELKYITTEAAKKGKAVVTCKNKTRVVLLPVQLQKKLRQYAKEKNIFTGSLFITRTGREMNRCNIWKEMKLLCEKAKVLPGKVFPHNLRHLFARTFYKIEHDIVKLADLLGHSSINTTRIYTVATGKEHRQKLEEMSLIL